MSVGGWRQQDRAGPPGWTHLLRKVNNLVEVWHGVAGVREQVVLVANAGTPRLDLPRLWLDVTALPPWGALCRRHGSGLCAALHCGITPRNGPKGVDTEAGETTVATQSGLCFGRSFAWRLASTVRRLSQQNATSKGRRGDERGEGEVEHSPSRSCAALSGAQICVPAETQSGRGRGGGEKGGYHLPFQASLSAKQQELFVGSCNVSFQCGLEGDEAINRFSLTSDDRCNLTNLARMLHFVVIFRTISICTLYCWPLAAPARAANNSEFETVTPSIRAV